jgi:hypothetical protein
MMQKQRRGWFQRRNEKNWTLFMSEEANEITDATTAVSGSEGKDDAEPIGIIEWILDSVVATISLVLPIC